MKYLLITTIAVVLLVGCGKSQDSSTPEVQLAEPVAELPAQQSTLPEAQPAEAITEVRRKQSTTPAEVELAKPIAEVTKQEPPTVKAPDQSAAKAPDISITQAAETGNIEAIRQHLAAGADVNTMAASLHRAAYGSHKEIAELLITNGVDVNAKNDAAETPLHLATTREIAELLIANGADVNATTNRGTTPLDWAANDEIANLIRQHGGKSGK